MDESFFYAVLRISVAQILKASGFDKCKPLTLNTMTDIYIKHFELVLNSAKKFGQARTSCTNVLEAPDLVQALLDVQLIKPLTGDGLLDPKDVSKEPETEYNVKSLESFVKWLQYSDNFNLAKRLSDVPNSQLRNLMEKRKIDTSAETDQEKKKRRLRERQEYYNQLKLGENPANAQFDGMADDLEEAEVTEHDKLSWLAYLAERDVKLGHNLQYANTVLQDTVLPIHKNSKFHPSKDGEDAYTKFLYHAHNNVRNDHVILNIQDADENEADDGETTRIQPSEKLKDALPYNVKYLDSLLNDDLQQYIEYAEKYGLPATPVSVESPKPMDVDEPQEEAVADPKKEDADKSDNNEGVTENEEAAPKTTEVQEAEKSQDEEVPKPSEAGEDAPKAEVNEESDDKKADEPEKKSTEEVQEAPSSESGPSEPSTKQLSEPEQPTEYTTAEEPTTKESPVEEEAMPDAEAETAPEAEVEAEAKNES